jgi:hypothetical protein
VDYFSPEENEVFAVASQLLEDFVRSRPGYEPKLHFGFFASSGSHMRMHLSANPRTEAVPAIMYRQWLVTPGGISTCSLTVGESVSQLHLNLWQPVATAAGELRDWLLRELPQ